MPRPPRARDRVLDAYVSILITEGERAATLEAVARAAGVSKGGLLYHFASKEDLAAGLVARLIALTEADLERMASAPEGPIAYYVRTSAMEDQDLERALVATGRLAQGGATMASAALRDVRTRWADAIRPHVTDETALDLVMLISDGLYFNNALTDATGDRLAGIVPTGAALDRLIAAVVQTTTRAPGDREPASRR